MILFEFNYTNGKLTKRIYEVIETKALYKLEKGYFERLFVSQINKKEIGVIRCESVWGFTAIYTTDAEETFLKEVTDMQKKRVQKAEEELNKQKNDLERLINKEYKKEQKGGEEK